MRKQRVAHQEGQNEEENEKKFEEKLERFIKIREKNEESGNLVHRDCVAGYGPVRKLFEKLYITLITVSPGIIIYFVRTNVHHYYQIGLLKENKHLKYSIGPFRYQNDQYI